MKTQGMVSESNMDKSEPSCRVCLSSEKQLIEEKVSLYNEVVCDCKGTSGAICHRCIERLVLVYHEKHCLHCMKNYRNIEFIYNFRWFEIMSKCVDELIGLYVILRWLAFCLIVVLKNIKISYMFFLLVLHYNGQSTPEVIAIRVNARKGFWAELWTKIRRKLGF